jgi:uncharacterized membrane protein YoaK (UPF0700 family)
MIEYIITFLVGAAAGGAGIWFFKNKAIAVLDKAKQDAEALVVRIKEEVDELKDKVKKD